MNIKEEINKLLDFKEIEGSSEKEEALSKIADNHALEFAYWFIDNTLRIDLDAYKTFGDNDNTKPHTIIELLEIFKNKENEKIS